jgi:hypothetical protein
MIDDMSSSQRKELLKSSKERKNISISTSDEYIVNAASVGKTKRYESEDFDTESSQSSSHAEYVVKSTLSPETKVDTLPKKRKKTKELVPPISDPLTTAMSTLANTMAKYLETELQHMEMKNVYSSTSKSTDTNK